MQKLLLAWEQEPTDGALKQAAAGEEGWYDTSNAREPEVSRYFKFREHGSHQWSQAGDCAGQVGNRLKELGRHKDEQVWRKADVALQLRAWRHRPEAAFSQNKLCVTLFDWAFSLEQLQKWQRAADAYLVMYEVAVAASQGVRSAERRELDERRFEALRQLGAVHGAHAAELERQVDAAEANDEDAAIEVEEKCRRLMLNRRADAARKVAVKFCEAALQAAQQLGAVKRANAMMALAEKLSAVSDSKGVPEGLGLLFAARKLLAAAKDTPDRAAKVAVMHTEALVQYNLADTLNDANHRQHGEFCVARVPEPLTSIPWERSCMLVKSAQSYAASALKIFQRIADEAGVRDTQDLQVALADSAGDLEQARTLLRARLKEKTYMDKARIASTNHDLQVIEERMKEGEQEKPNPHPSSEELRRLAASAKREAGRVREARELLSEEACEDLLDQHCARLTLGAALHADGTTRVELRLSACELYEVVAQLAESEVQRVAALDFQEAELADVLEATRAGQVMPSSVEQKDVAQKHTRCRERLVALCKEAFPSGGLPTPSGVLPTPEDEVMLITSTPVQLDRLRFGGSLLGGAGHKIFDGARGALLDATVRPHVHDRDANRHEQRSNPDPSTSHHRQQLSSAIGLEVVRPVGSSNAGASKVGRALHGAKRQRPAEDDDENGHAHRRETKQSSTAATPDDGVADEHGDDDALGPIDVEAVDAASVPNQASDCAETKPAAPMERWPPIAIMVDLDSRPNDRYTFYLPHQKSDEGIRRAEERSESYGTTRWLLDEVNANLTLEHGLVMAPQHPLPQVLLHKSMSADDLPSPDTPLPQSLSLHSLGPQVQLVVTGRLQFTTTPEEAYATHCRRRNQQPHAAVEQCISTAISKAASIVAHDVDCSTLGIHGEALDTLCEFLGSWSHGLSSLRLSDLPVGAATLQLFTEGLPSLAPLQDLDLSRQRLTPHALTHLLAAAERDALVSLRCLDLSHNPIGDASPAWPSSLTAAETAMLLGRLLVARGRWNLRSLGLADAFLGDLGVATFVDSIHGTELASLDLRGNHAVSASTTERLGVSWSSSGKASSGLRVGRLW